MGDNQFIQASGLYFLNPLSESRELFKEALFLFHHLKGADQSHGGCKTIYPGQLTARTILTYAMSRQFYPMFVQFFASPSVFRKVFQPLALLSTTKMGDDDAV
jgi:hypothetical protein